jgi:hypothetical protein
VAERHSDFRAMGLGVIAVSMSRPDGVARYLAGRPLPFPLLADPDRRAYAAFGLARTTWWRMIRPGIGWRYLRAVLRGGRVRGVPEGEDPLQTGGDFLVAADRRLLWAYTSPDPTDRPAAARLLEVARGRLHRAKCP